MRTEANILQAVRLYASKLGLRLFRNNVGLFTTNTGRKVRTGLCKGSSDLIGWTPITITQDMLGKTVAVFTAVECKTEKGRASKEQLNFIEQVKANGGFAVIARGEQDIHELQSDTGLRFR